MTSNPEPIVQQLQQEFQNLLAYVTGPDAGLLTTAAHTIPYSRPCFPARLFAFPRRTRVEDSSFLPNTHTDAEANAYMNIIHDLYENNSLDWLIRTAYIPNQAVG